MLANAGYKPFEFLEFHEVVALVNRLILSYSFFVLSKLFIALVVYLFCNKVLLLGKLLHSEADRLLQVDTLLLEPLNFLVENLESFIMFFVLLEGPSHFLLLNHNFIQH